MAEMIPLIRCDIHFGIQEIKLKTWLGTQFRLWGDQESSCHLLNYTMNSERKPFKHPGCPILYQSASGGCKPLFWGMPVDRLSYK